MLARVLRVVLPPYQALSALVPDGLTFLDEVPTDSGGCKDMERNRCLPHVLPAPRRCRNVLMHPESAAKEVA